MSEFDDIETRLDEVERFAGARTAREWVEKECMRRLNSDDLEVQPVFGEDNIEPDGTVIYVSIEGSKFGVAPERIPDWIDPEEDLPIEGEPDSQIPFVVARFGDSE